MRNRGERQVLGYVPTDAERTGDFSEWLTRFPVANPAQCDGTDTSPGNCRYLIYDPSTFSTATNTRTPFPTTSSPIRIRSRWLTFHTSRSPTSLPQSSTSFYNWSGTNTSGIDNNNYSARADYTLTRRDSLYFRYSHDYGSRLLEGGLIPELALGNGPVHTTEHLPGALGTHVWGHASLTNSTSA